MTETPHTPLEACPHCGGHAYDAHLSGTAWFIDVDHAPGCFSGDFMRNREQAIAAWNTRATPLPTTANNPETDAHGEMLSALKWIADNYENGMINHVDFRVGAKHRADAALTKAEVTHG